jgi:hypothetical protein
MLGQPATAAACSDIEGTAVYATQRVSGIWPSFDRRSSRLEAQHGEGLWPLIAVFGFALRSAEEST